MTKGGKISITKQKVYFAKTYIAIVYALLKTNFWAYLYHA